jgi:hypothetical protein
VTGSRKLVRTANPEDVYSLTTDGWEVVARIDDRQRVAITDYEIEKAGNKVVAGQTYQTWVPAIMGQRIDVITEPMFVLEKDAESATHEAQLKAELFESNTQLYSLRDKLAGHDKEMEAAQAAKLLAEAKLAEEKNLNAKHTKELSELRASEKKLRADMEKLRREVGEGRWRALVQEMGIDDGSNQTNKA